MKKSYFKSHGGRFLELEEKLLASLEIGKDIKPGQKYPLLAHNPERVGKGRRFAYVGVDHEIHVGRKGKPMKVKMLWN